MNTNTNAGLNLCLFGESAEPVVAVQPTASDPAAEAAERTEAVLEKNENICSEQNGRSDESVSSMPTGTTGSAPTVDTTVQNRLSEQSIRAHFAMLERQAAEVKSVFPDFDLRTELRNPVFARLTAPGVGISVEDAYYTVHRKELHAEAMRRASEKTAEQLSNAIRSGSRRPNESGTSSQAPSVSTFNYAGASREQREAFKKDIRARMARGEKVYPATSHR